MANRYPPRRRLNGPQQSTMLLAALSTFRRIRRGNPYVWEGILRPTDLSQEYRVRISYFAAQRPRVEVIDPPLVPLEEGGRIPHTFSSGGLCLHLPGEWERSMYIHKTIVPWTSLWLYHYEIWRATGEWRGGGHTVPADADDVDHDVA